MPEIPAPVVQTDTMKNYADRGPWFQQAVKVPTVLEINPENQPRLMSLEIDQIERAR